MRCIVYLEERFLRDKEGHYYSVVFGDEYWARYLMVYDSVFVVARVESVSSDNLTAHHQIIEDERITFRYLPYYKGPIQFLRRITGLISALYRCVSEEGVHILRLPGAIGTMALPFLLVKRRHFGIELVGDPNSVFSSGVGGFLSSVYKHIFTFLTRVACQKATAVAYVTKSVMQGAYPASSTAFMTYYSSIQLSSELIVTSRIIKPYTNEHPFTILMVGSMEQRYKGFDLMVEALHILRSGGRNVIVKIAGAGAYQQELEQLATRLDVSKYVFFLGMVSRSCVLSLMDEADLFVMPSRTEGLPRALIEAMARGLPAIGSDVGGIPELLEQKFIFKSGDYAQLAVMIDELMDDAVLMQSMSNSNISTARSYEISVLRARQHDFYTYLLDANG